MGKNDILINNRKAGYNYTFVEEFESGIILNGCEIKSIRNRDVNMSDSYCSFTNSELYIKNMHIAPYKNASHTVFGDCYDPKRDRKLLLKKRELRKLEQAVKAKGYTIVPVKLYTNEKGIAKITIALAKGKHSYDKSQAIKERDLDREMKDF